MPTQPVSTAPKVLPMNEGRRVSLILLSLWLTGFILCGTSLDPPVTMAQPRGEIRVVESWRPDINVLGHNVLQYLFEYALDRNELVPCLAVSRRWVDDTTLELKLREGVRFHNGEAFDAEAVKFNFEYQRKNNPGRGGTGIHEKGTGDSDNRRPHGTDPT